jgi:hypothetical protein
MFSFSQEKNIKAAENFSKFGLLNIQTSKVELNALVFKDDLDKFEKIKSNFNSNINIKIWSSHDDSVQEKIHTYLQDNFTDLQSNRRWVMQVDDDSSTDVNNLLNLLDFYYDCTDPVLLTTCKVYNDFNKKEESIRLFRKYLKQPMDFKTMFFDKKFIHRLSGNTWETGIISHGGMSKIYKTINTTSFFNDFKQIRLSSAGDRWFDFLGYLCKIPTIISPILSHFNFIDNFSLNGGSVCHIHYLKDESYKSLFLLEYVNEFILNKKIKIYYEDTEASSEKTIIKEFPAMVFLENGKIDLLEDKTNLNFENSFSRWLVEKKFFYIINSKNQRIMGFQTNNFYKHKLPKILLFGEFIDTKVDEKLIMKLLD